MSRFFRILFTACFIMVPFFAHAVESFSMKQPSAVQAEPVGGSDVLAQLRAGQVVLKIQQTEGWAQVFFMSDIDQPIKGWVPVSALAVIGKASVQSGVAESTPFNSRVSANSLRVRAGAGTGFAVVGRLVNNQQVVSLRKESGWTQIRFKEKSKWQEGWVASKYLQVN